MARTNDTLYRHYVDKAGAFRTERYKILQLMLIPSAYRIVPDGTDGDARDLPAGWVGVPRAAELWTADPDPDKAYGKLLSSAKKDMETARGRLAVYEGLYEKLKNAERRHADE